MRNGLPLLASYLKIHLQSRYLVVSPLAATSGGAGTGIVTRRAQSEVALEQLF